MAVYSLRSGKILHIPDLPSEYSYPNEWFNKNPGKKPAITVCYTQDKPGLRESLVRSLYAEINLKRICKENAITFLYIYARDSMKETLNEDWKSYSLTIGLKGSTITPINIIDANLKDFNFENLKETNVQLPSSDDWLAFYLCAIYRLDKAAMRMDDTRKRIANYAKKEILKISQHNAIRALDFNVEGYLACDYNYCGLIAAYDMFLYKFPNSSAKFCRFGTSESHLRDCAALSSFYNACKCLGMKNQKNFIEWILTPVVRVEFKCMFSEKEEYWDEYSYFMYQKDFHLLSNKCGYSASAKPYTHFFCNVLAALCLDERGLRAKKLHQVSRECTIIGNCILIAYVYHRRTLGEMVDESEPKSQNIKEWLRFMQPNGWKLTENMIKWFDDIRTKMIRTNAGTVGEFLKNIDKNLLCQQSIGEIY